MPYTQLVGSQWTGQPLDFPLWVKNNCDFVPVASDRNSSRTRHNDRWREEQAYGRGRLHTKNHVELRAWITLGFKGARSSHFHLRLLQRPCLRHGSLEGSMGSVMPLFSTSLALPAAAPSPGPCPIQVVQVGSSYHGRHPHLRLQRT